MKAQSAAKISFNTVETFTCKQIKHQIFSALHALPYTEKKNSKWCTQNTYTLWTHVNTNTLTSTHTYRKKYDSWKRWEIKRWRMREKNTFTDTHSHTDKLIQTTCMCTHSDYMHVHCHLQFCLCHQSCLTQWLCAWHRSSRGGFSHSQ